MDEEVEKPSILHLLAGIYPMKCHFKVMKLAIIFFMHGMLFLISLSQKGYCQTDSVSFINYSLKYSPEINKHENA